MAMQGLGRSSSHLAVRIFTANNATWMFWPPRWSGRSRQMPWSLPCVICLYLKASSAASNGSCCVMICPCLPPNSGNIQLHLIIGSRLWRQCDGKHKTPLCPHKYNSLTRTNSSTYAEYRNNCGGALIRMRLLCADFFIRLAIARSRDCCQY